MSDTFTLIGEAAASVLSTTRERKIKLSLPPKPSNDDIIAAMCDRIMASFVRLHGKNETYHDGDYRHSHGVSVRTTAKVKAYLADHPLANTGEIAQAIGRSKSTVLEAKKRLREERI